MGRGVLSLIGENRTQNAVDMNNISPLRVSMLLWKRQIPKRADCKVADKPAAMNALPPLTSKRLAEWYGALLHGMSTSEVYKIKRMQCMRLRSDVCSIRSCSNKAAKRLMNFTWKIRLFLRHSRWLENMFLYCSTEMVDLTISACT